MRAFRVFGLCFAQQARLHALASRAIVEGRVRVLVLTRKSNQSIMIGDDVEVTVLSVVGEKVRIGIQAPHEVPVFRTEIYIEIHQNDSNESSSGSDDVRAEVNEALRELGKGG